jgi:uncharacterized membrane protein
LYSRSQPITLHLAVLSDISDNADTLGNIGMPESSIQTNVQGHFDGTCWCWHLKRNVSISPALLAMLFGGLSLVTLSIGSAFYWAGASLILPFSMIEVAALLVAYFYNAVHANDYEKLVLTDSTIEIESKIGFNLRQVQLLRSMTRIDPEVHKNELIQIRQGTQSTFFGRFVHANLRPALAQKISERLMSRFNPS